MLVELPVKEEEQTIETISSSNDILDKIIQLLREINNLLNNPNIINMISKKVQTNQQQALSQNDYQQQATNFELNEQTILNMLQDANVRAKLINAIDKLIVVIGDIKLSELKQMLVNFDANKFSK